jgi:hypothetical protein
MRTLERECLHFAHVVYNDPGDFPVGKMLRAILSHLICGRDWEPALHLHLFIKGPPRRPQVTPCQKQHQPTKRTQECAQDLNNVASPAHEFPRNLRRLSLMNRRNISPQLMGHPGPINGTERNDRGACRTAVFGSCSGPRDSVFPLPTAGGDPTGTLTPPHVRRLTRALMDIKHSGTAATKIKFF